MTKPTEVLDALDEAAEEGDRVSADEVADHLGQRSIGALLAIPAALELTPIGGVPGVPTVLALIVALFAAQIALGREDLWLPGFLGNRRVEGDKLHGAADKLRPAARWADRHLGRHLTVLVDGPAPRIAALAILALCATVPFLEIVPFASSIPMATIVLFGMALVTRDGRVMALAWLCTAAAAAGIWWVWP